MITKSLKKSSTVQTYAQLVMQVRKAIAAGKERALEAVEREGVRTKWEVGKLIHEHILLNQSRAEYGKRVLLRLSRDIGVSDRELRYMVEFVRTNPIWRVSAKLPWSHIESLLAVNEDEAREELTKRASQEKLTLDKTRSEIKKLKSAKQITVSETPAEELLIPIRGKLDTYRIVTAKAGPWTGQTALDLGFANYHRPLTGGFPFRDKEIVSASPAGKLIRAKDATEGDLFTYRAYLLQVTDADTLWVIIDLGFGFVTQQQLRLRGIDAPEITTREGQEAKRFVERELKKASSIMITSTKSDKYDRYLADVFYTVNGKEYFLNNRLLQAGLAERV